MSASFEPRKKESAVDTVVNSIKKLILDKELKPGDKLPTEIEIASGLEVSRGSVREAMKILSAFGIIEVKVGSGTYISDRMNNKMADSFIFSFLATNPDMNQFVEFRKIMETDIMEMIILHYDENEEERVELAENVEQLKKLKLTPEATTDEFVENDMEFHKLLGKASKNLLLERIYGCMIDFLNPSLKYIHRAEDRGANAEIAHSEMLLAIEKKDYDMALKAVECASTSWANVMDR